jgi:hypothetical protein
MHVTHDYVNLHQRFDKTYVYIFSRSFAIIILIIACVQYELVKQLDPWHVRRGWFKKINQLQSDQLATQFMAESVY